MIESFQHRGLKRFFEQNDPRRLPADMVNRIPAILVRLSIAETIDDMAAPEYHLHELTGNRKSTWSVTVRANWRVTFQFENGQAHGVNFEDYHEEKG